MPKFHETVIEAARNRSSELVRQWLPAGTLQGKHWRVGNIWGDKGDSLHINLDTGQWNDFAEPTQKGQNLVSLYMAIHGMNFNDAVQAVAKELEAIGIAIQREHKAHATKKTLEAIVPVPPDAPAPPLKAGLRQGAFSMKQWWKYETVQGECICYAVRFDHEMNLSKKGKPEKKILPLAYFGPEHGWQYKGIGDKGKNPLYNLPGLESRLDAPVLLVEGEKACDAATILFPDYVAISWMGGVGQIGKADFSALEGRSVTYWPDVDEAGERSVTPITDAMRAAGVAEFRVVEPPLGFPVSWDVADAAPAGVNLSDILDGAKPVDLMKGKPFHMLTGAELVERLIFNAGTEQFIDTLTGMRFATSQIDALFRHTVEDNRKMSTTLLSSPALIKVVGLTYRPGVEEQIVTDGNGCRLFNSWRPSSIVAEPGDASFFENHLRYLCTTEEEFEILANCLAFMVQHPGEKLKFAPVIVGKQGTGKSAVASIMCRLIGMHNTTIASTSEVRSSFNEWAIEKELIIVEEIMALGRVELMNALKALITELRISVNIKHLRRFEIENKANFLFLSNHDDALKLEADDRRYFVIVSDKQPKDETYYKEFFRRASENLGTILHWLQSRDLSDFNPNKRPPMTAGKRMMIQRSKDPRQHLIEEMIAEREPPFEYDLVEIGKIAAILTGPGGAAVGMGLSRPALQKHLTGVGAKPLGQKKAIIGRGEVRYSLWAIRDAERYSGMSGQRLIEIYRNENKS